MKQTTILCLAAATALLSACGDSKEDRIASGALIGASAGAVIGATTGAPVTGAALGAIAGGAAGGITDKSQINLGKPLWK